MSMPRDDVAQDFEAVPTSARTEGCLQRKAVALMYLHIPPDLLRLAETPLRSLQLSEQGRIQRSASGRHRGNVPGVMLGQPGQVGTRVWTLTDEPTGHSDAV